MADASDRAGMLQAILLGGCAGIFGELLVQPALVVRTRMMVQGCDRGGMTQYTSFSNACSTMLRTEGIGAFYKGAAVNATFTPVARGLYMAGVEFSKRTLGEGTPVRDFATGASAQLVSSLAYIPRDIVVERCAIDGQLTRSVGSCRSSTTAIRTMVAHEGVRGFYRAYVPHQLVWIPFNGLFFSLYGQAQAASETLGFKRGFSLDVLNTFCAAAMAAWATTPLDIVKTRLQVQRANPEVFEFNGAVDCAVKLAHKEGLRGLFSGSVGRIMYMGPNMAVFIPVYELMRRFMA